MMNKKAITLSINMIVIVILAIVTLGIGIAFITGLFEGLDERFEGAFPSLEIPPTSDDPISFIPAKAARGEKTPMTIGFFNNELEDISQSVKPSIVCEGIDNLDITVSGITIPIRESNEYNALITVPKSTVPGPYSCTMTISQTQKSFFLEVI